MPVVGSAAYVVPVLGSAAIVIPLTGSELYAIPVIGSDAHIRVPPLPSSGDKRLSPPVQPTHSHSGLVLPNDQTTLWGQSICCARRAALSESNGVIQRKRRDMASSS